MEFVTTLPRKAPDLGAFLMKQSRESTYNKRFISKFKPTDKHKEILLDALSVSYMLREEKSYSSPMNKVRAKVLKMRIRASLTALYKYSPDIDKPEGESVCNRLERAMGIYRLMEIRSTKKMRQDFFECIAIAKKLL